MTKLLREDTILKNYPLYCPKCKQHTLIETQNIQITVIKVIRINKGTLLNITALVNVRPYPNHRLLAELSNGEHLIISRKYISVLQNTIRSENYVKSV